MTAQSDEVTIQLAAEKALRRLDEALAVLRSGGEAQPGKLIALALLTFEARSGSAQGYIAWRDFLLQDAAERLRSGASLTRSHALPIEEKCALLEAAQRGNTSQSIFHPISHDRHPSLPAYGHICANVFPSGYVGMSMPRAGRWPTRMCC